MCGVINARCDAADSLVVLSTFVTSDTVRDTCDTQNNRRLIVSNRFAKKKRRDRNHRIAKTRARTSDTRIETPSFVRCTCSMRNRNRPFPSLPLPLSLYRCRSGAGKQQIARSENTFFRRCSVSCDDKRKTIHGFCRPIRLLVTRSVPLPRGPHPRGGDNIQSGLRSTKIGALVPLRASDASLNFATSTTRPAAIGGAF